MKANWKEKLSSRKFWMSVTAMIVSIMTLMNVPEGTATQIAGIVGSFGSLLVYILCETAVDVARINMNRKEGKINDKQSICSEIEKYCRQS